MPLDQVLQTRAISDENIIWHLHDLLRATAPAGETETAEEARANAVAGMFVSLDPRTDWQAARACRLIRMDFALSAAMRRLHDAQAAEPEKLSKLAQAALAISRELRQHETQYEKSKAPSRAAAAANPERPAAAEHAAERSIARPTAPPAGPDSGPPRPERAERSAAAPPRPSNTAVPPRPPNLPAPAGPSSTPAASGPRLPAIPPAIAGAGSAASRDP